MRARRQRLEAPASGARPQRRLEAQRVPAASLGGRRRSARRRPRASTPARSSLELGDPHAPRSAPALPRELSSGGGSACASPIAACPARPWSRSSRARSVSSSHSSACCARPAAPPGAPAGAAPGAVRRRRGSRRCGSSRASQPAAVGDLLALAPAGADHQRLAGADLVHDGSAVAIRCGCSTRLRTARRLPSWSRVESPRATPAPGCSADSETGSITVARAVVTAAGSGSGSIARCRRARRDGEQAPPPAPRRARRAGAERLQHDHALGLRVRAVAQQVAAVRRAQRPRELELQENEQPLGHRCTVSLRSTPVSRPQGTC